MTDLNVDSLLINGGPLKAELRSAITDATITRTIDSSPTLAITVEDQNRFLLKQGYFAQRLTAQVDDYSFELAQLKKTKNLLKLTMEDLAVAELRKHNTPRKAEAGTVSRTDFVRAILADETPWIKLFVDPSVHEPIATVELARGLTTSNTNGSQADPNYFNSSGVGTTPSSNLTANQIAGVASTAGFTGQNLVIAVAVALAESGGNAHATHVNTNHSTDYGLWQINSVHSNLLKGANWADPLVNAKMAYSISGGSNWHPWSTFNNGAYRSHMGAAQAAVGAIDPKYTVPTGGSTTVGVPPKVAAGLEPPEDSWTCFKRIFAAVNWRLYADKGNLYAGPDSAFIDKAPNYSFAEFKNGVDNIDFDWDVGKVVATATITCRAPRWVVSPSTVVTLEHMGLPAKWLVTSFSRSLFSVATTIIVSSPQPELPEPTPASGEATADYFGQTAGSSANGGASNGRFIFPCANHNVNSPFGSPRPGGRKHQGVDLGATTGSSIWATAAGTVTQTANDPAGYGLWIEINHGGGAVSRYAHLQKFECRVGMTVAQGQEIAKSDSGGDATGPHLHFEIRLNGTPVDPIPLLTNGGPPVNIGTVKGGPPRNQQIPIKPLPEGSLLSLLGQHK